MDRLKRIRKQIKRLTGKIHKLEQKRQMLMLQEYAITDDNIIHEMYPKIMLNSLYGKTVYADTDSIKDCEDGMKYTE